MKKGYKRRKPQDPERSKKEEISDLEIAKKMLKIYQSAQDRKIEFDMSFEAVKKLMSYTHCYYTNRRFEEDGQFARSFDRIDSAKGYIDGNVVACTVDINGKKSNLSLEELELLYHKLTAKLHKPKIEEAVVPPVPEITQPPADAPPGDI